MNDILAALIIAVVIALAVVGGARLLGVEGLTAVAVALGVAAAATYLAARRTRASGPAGQGGPEA
jgi:hypothetical protein